MGKKFQRIFYMTVLVLLSVAVGVCYVQAEEQRDMRGWEENSPYNKHYDVKEYEKFRATVIGFKEEPPMEGM